MIPLLIVSPILVPFFTAILCIFFWTQPKVQRGLTVIGQTALLVISVLLLANVWQDGILAVQIGSWQAPFGISIVADLLSSIMTVLAGIMGVAVAVYSLYSIDEAREAYGYYPLLNILLMGVCGAFLTGDLFNMYVWFEVMLIASFVLLALGGEQSQIEGAIKYVTLNLLSSAIFLTAVGLLYGLFGTLNMADLAVAIERVMFEAAASDDPETAARIGLVTTLSVMFLVAFGIKAAAFPLFFWLPASYHTPPVAVSAIFAGLLTKVGVYALIRVFTLLFIQDIEYTHTFLLMWIAGLTMVSGVLGAAAQNEFRRILSFHIVSQIGYMLMGLAIDTRLAIAGSVFYITHHIIVKTNLFLVSGVVHRLRGTFELKKLGGLYVAYPFLAILFIIPAFSLAGIPPLSGFWAKVVLVQAGLEAEQYWIVATSLVVSILTLYSMTKIWAAVFWGAPPEGEAQEATPGNTSTAYALMVPIAVLAVMTLTIGFWTQPFFDLAMAASDQLLNPSEYIQSVLGPTAAALER